MELKGRRHKGKCHVKDCKQLSVAAATSQSFFSARGKDIELCEEHLLEAKDMAARQGKELCLAEKRESSAIDSLSKNELQAEIDKDTNEAEGFLAQLQEFSISSKDDVDFAAELLAEVKGHINRLKAQCKEITAPMNDALRATRALFSPVLGHYAEAERLLKRALSEAHQAAQVQQQVALDAHDVDAAEQAAELPRAKGVQYRTRWRYEITNPEAVPREYCCPDLNLIAAAVKTDHTIEIPGVRIWEETNVASKAV